MKDEMRDHPSYRRGRLAYPGGDVTCIGIDTPEMSSMAKTAWWLGWLDARFKEKWGEA